MCKIFAKVGSQATLGCTVAPLRKHLELEDLIGLGTLASVDQSVISARRELLQRITTFRVSE